MSRDLLLPSKGSIIREMYLYTADANYIVARWSHDNGLMVDFFWNAVHALEKYMKAVLLFNGRSTKTFGHGLVELYGELEKLAGALLPGTLTRPVDLDIFHWRDMTPSEFLQKLDQNGNADNRYLTFGYAQHAWYLHMLDSMVWIIRRLALPLDTPIGGKKRTPPPPTERDILARQPDYAPNHMLLLEETMGKPESDKQRALLNLNMAFASTSYPHEPRRSGFSARNPVLLRRILEPLKSKNPDVAREGYQVGKWLLTNTKQSKPVQQEISDAMAGALRRLPGIDKAKP